MPQYKEQMITCKIIKILRLKDVKKIYRPMLHGVGWLGDVKRIALKIEKTKRLGFKPSMISRKAMETTARKLLEETSVKI